jgi:hypothetical protein
MAVMSVRGDQATALIERICDAHRDRDPEGPLVTRLDAVWAFCAGHRASEHEWRVIEPTPRQVVEDGFPL